MILKVYELRLFSIYLFLSSSSLSSATASFMRLRAPVIFSGLDRSIEHAAISPCSSSSSSQEEQLLPSSCESWAELIGVFIGASVRFGGGALVVGAGGALLLDFSAFPIDMSFSRLRRCSRCRIASISCVLSLC